MKTTEFYVTLQVPHTFYAAMAVDWGIIVAFNRPLFIRMNTLLSLFRG